MQPPRSHIEQVLAAELSKARPGQPPQQIPLSDQARILATDIGDVLAGTTTVVDDREPRPH